MGYKNDSAEFVDVPLASPATWTNTQVIGGQEHIDFLHATIISAHAVSMFLTGAQSGGTKHTYTHSYTHINTHTHT